MECVKCGHQNGEDKSSCEVCGLLLADIETTADGRVHPVYDKYVEMRKAAEQIASGAWTIDEYRKFLDNISFRMARTEQELREIEIPPDATEDLREEMEVGFDGIDLYNRALVNFRQFVSSNSPDFLRTGLELAWRGNERINEARAINRRNRAMHEDAEMVEAPAEPETADS